MDTMTNPYDQVNLDAFVLSEVGVIQNRAVFRIHTEGHSKFDVCVFRDNLVRDLMENLDSDDWFVGYDPRYIMFTRGDLTLAVGSAGCAALHPRELLRADVRADGHQASRCPDHRAAHQTQRVCMTKREQKKRELRVHARHVQMKREAEELGFTRLNLSEGGLAYLHRVLEYCLSHPEDTMMYMSGERLVDERVRQFIGQCNAFRKAELFTDAPRELEFAMFVRDDGFMPTKVKLIIG
jgi:hypothetical protein